MTKRSDFSQSDDLSHELTKDIYPPTIANEEIEAGRYLEKILPQYYLWEGTNIQWHEIPANERKNDIAVPIIYMDNKVPVPMSTLEIKQGYVKLAANHTVMFNVGYYRFMIKLAKTTKQPRPVTGDERDIDKLVSRYNKVEEIRNILRKDAALSNLPYFTVWGVEAYMQSEAADLCLRWGITPKDYQLHSADYDTSFANYYGLDPSKYLYNTSFYEVVKMYIMNGKPREIPSYEKRIEKRVEIQALEGTVDERLYTLDKMHASSGMKLSKQLMLQSRKDKLRVWRQFVHHMSGDTIYLKFPPGTLEDMEVISLARFIRLPGAITITQYNGSCYV